MLIIHTYTINYFFAIIYLFEIRGNNMNYQQAYEKLNKINQTHLLKLYDELNEEEKNILLNKIEKTDFSVLSITEIKKEKEVISPIKTLTLEEIKKEEEEDRLLGIASLKENKVACLLPAEPLSLERPMQGKVLP